MRQFIIPLWGLLLMTGCLGAKPTDPMCLEEPFIMGSCSGSYTRWSYNPSWDICVPFSFSGCAGNNNNFVSKESCSEICIGSSKSAKPASRSNDEIKSDKPANQISDADFDNMAKRCFDTMADKAEVRHNTLCENATFSKSKHSTGWSFDSAVGQCVNLPYHLAACAKTTNKFIELSECQRVCEAHKDELAARSGIKLGYPDFRQREPEHHGRHHHQKSQPDLGRKTSIEIYIRPDDSNNNRRESYESHEHHHRELDRHRKHHGHYQHRQRDRKPTQHQHFHIRESSSDWIASCSDYPVWVVDLFRYGWKTADTIEKQSGYSYRQSTNECVLVEDIVTSPTLNKFYTRQDCHECVKLRSRLHTPKSPCEEPPRISPPHTCPARYHYNDRASHVHRWAYFDGKCVPYIQDLCEKSNNAWKSKSSCKRHCKKFHHWHKKFHHLHHRHHASSSEREDRPKYLHRPDHHSIYSPLHHREGVYLYKPYKQTFHAMYLYYLPHHFHDRHHRHHRHHKRRHFGSHESRERRHKSSSESRRSDSHESRHSDSHESRHSDSHESRHSNERYVERRPYHHRRYESRSFEYGRERAINPEEWIEYLDEPQGRAYDSSRRRKNRKSRSRKDKRWRPSRDLKHTKRLPSKNDRLPLSSPNTLPGLPKPLIVQPPIPIGPGNTTQTLAPRCTAFPPPLGTCKENKPAWVYLDGDCKEIVFNWCQGQYNEASDNIFRSKEDCLKTCGSNAQQSSGSYQMRGQRGRMSSICSATPSKIISCAEKNADASQVTAQSSESKFGRGALGEHESQEHSSGRSSSDEEVGDHHESHKKSVDDTYDYFGDWGEKQGRMGSSYEESSYEPYERASGVSYERSKEDSHERKKRDIDLGENFLKEAASERTEGATPTAAEGEATDSDDGVLSELQSFRIEEEEEPEDSFEDDVSTDSTEEENKDESAEAVKDEDGKDELDRELDKLIEDEQKSRAREKRSADPTVPNTSVFTFENGECKSLIVNSNTCLEKTENYFTTLEACMSECS